MESKLFAALMLATSLVTGCATATSGHEFRAENVQQLTPGKTTVDQAKALLGKPYQVVTMSNGQSLYIWQYVRSTGTIGHVDTQMQQASIVFDQSGHMVKIQQLINVPPNT